MGIKRSSSSSSLSDVDSPRGADDNSPTSVVETSPSSAHNTSGGSSSAAEYHTASQNLPSSSRIYNRSPSTSSTYYSTPYASSDNSAGPSPTKYPRRDGPPSNSGGGNSSSSNYSPRQTESTLNGLYIPSITGKCP